MLVDRVHAVTSQRPIPWFQKAMVDWNNVSSRHFRAMLVTGRFRGAIGELSHISVFDELRRGEWFFLPLLCFIPLIHRSVGLFLALCHAVALH